MHVVSGRGSLICSMKNAVVQIRRRGKPCKNYGICRSVVYTHATHPTFVDNGIPLPGLPSYLSLDSQ